MPRTGSVSDSVACEAKDQILHETMNGPMRNAGTMTAL
ncbi:hypothetical protein SBA5_290163 [Candidatus Sulfotelmatomonas gaucii]|uniref:Uncharacterized protein n=1 Tax=Candidatus Sulfuritelmatomonas gaucii TaxID=2043161 RepID=A0A2N9LAI9_9BACT|nr:hypothetical protein SBA5_290163 [Candidatus Sulfotelmatomonas gaucii]